jgi:hypothetical protein
MHRPKASLVVRHIGTDRSFNSETRISMGVVENDVDSPRALRRGAAEVEISSPATRTVQRD